MALLALLALLCVSAVADDSRKIMVVPQPQEVSAGAGGDGVAVELRPASMVLDKSFEDTPQLSEDAKQYIEQAYDRCVTQTMNLQQKTYQWVLSLHPQIQNQLNNTGVPAHTLSTVQVTLTASDPSPTLEIGVDESYHLEVDDTIHITAPTVWGVLRAFETVAQLIDWNGQNFTIQHTPIIIEDHPRFPWRGMMVDTARHFLPLSKLKQIVDGLASLKFNVLHLHLTDAQSFPYDLPSFPQLSKSGCFEPGVAMYSHDDMQDLIAHAYSLGITVIPEFDMPGHTASWGLGYPGVTADCWDYLKTAKPTYTENGVALNPADQRTTQIIDALAEDAAKVFSKSNYIHVGGDEVNEGCWQQCAQREDIVSFMKQHNLAGYDALQVWFTNYTQQAVFTNDKLPIVWEDAFLNGGVFDKRTVVAAWRSKTVLQHAVQGGNNAILLYGYYQDMQAPLCTSSQCPDCDVHWMWVWTYVDMYNNDPTSGLNLTAEQQDRVLGGEAASWGESVDALSWDQRSLTRSPAVAERLWSAPDVKDRNWLEVRVDRVRCIALRRGVSQAGPLYSEYCRM
eukprot:TRINITY_DN18373_c0_g1_i1.p1 TRINITY_DN18373_c0_g1~~TRINITY_DN18373_c0_g1_i1.p1  ORF type:complete len:565 (+),score=149.57 TRINITY_DN18373_c0_g1_i1:29-1723(+)